MSAALLEEVQRKIAKRVSAALRQGGWDAGGEEDFDDDVLTAVTVGLMTNADELEAALQQQGEAVAWIMQYRLNGELHKELVWFDGEHDEREYVPLYTHPPKPVASDEMVARAIAAYIAHRGLCEKEEPPEHDEMRAAIEAALGVKS